MPQSRVTARSLSASVMSRLLSYSPLGDTGVKE